ncbi:hypothetical protein FD25_GL002618 [Levilactobacillus acidifarinae DSM 19394]|uniref:HTH tetR-type domain-containing protein n=2 Tax=Levilactobacillus acidifarinae TaxID=267364 RepID=A0A0R1LKQ4_9LACO|nr:hypothetical protein FD25_GL002618 [Levilactobacillus acidifarinae DSM 19394]
MVDLAKQAGVSRAKLYIYFKNKDEIVAAVVGRRLQFLQKYPVPTQATATTLVPTILNALLLMGSTTTRFERELLAVYPQQYRTFMHAYETYHRQLVDFYQDAQAHQLLVADLSAEYLLFQSQVSVRGILQGVQTGQLTLDQGERYLREGFTFQLRALLVDSQLAVTPETRAFGRVIIQEYYDTYARTQVK